MKRSSLISALIFLGIAALLSLRLYPSAKPAARKDDQTAHGGTIIHGCSTVIIGGKPAARVDDNHTCPLTVPPGVPHVGGPIFSGSQSVIIGGKRAARVGDQATCQNGPPDSIITGCPTVLIGD